MIKHDRSRFGATATGAAVGTSQDRQATMAKTRQNFNYVSGWLRASGNNLVDYLPLGSGDCRGVRLNLSSKSLQQSTKIVTL